MQEDYKPSVFIIRCFDLTDPDHPNKCTELSFARSLFGAKRALVAESIDLAKKITKEREASNPQQTFPYLKGAELKNGICAVWGEVSHNPKCIDIIDVVNTKSQGWIWTSEIKSMTTLYHLDFIQLTEHSCISNVRKEVEKQYTTTGHPESGVVEKIEPYRRVNKPLEWYEPHDFLLDEMIAKVKERHDKK